MRMYLWEEGIQASLLYLNNWNFETNTAFKKFFHSLASKFIENPPVQNGVIQCQRIQGKIKCSNFGPYVLWFYVVFCFFFLFFFSSPSIERERGYKDSCLRQPFTSGRSQIWEGLCFLEWDGSFSLCSLSYRRWWRLIHSTCFCPIAWYRSHRSHTCRTQEVLYMGKQPSTWAFTSAVERAEVQRWPAWGWLWWMDKQSHKSGTLWNLPIFKCFRFSFLYCAGQMKHICGPNSVHELPVCSLWWMGSFICFQDKLFHPLPKGFISTIA